MSVRYRLAVRLLGYRPYRLPEGEGTTIILRQKGGTVAIEATTLKVEIRNELAPIPASDASLTDWFPRYRRTGPTGTFSGTIGEMA